MISHLYGQPERLNMDDRHLCKKPLESLLLAKVSIQRRWLRRIRDARERHIPVGQVSDTVNCKLRPTEYRPDPSFHGTRLGERLRMSCGNSPRGRYTFVFKPRRSWNGENLLISSCLFCLDIEGFCVMVWHFNTGIIINLDISNALL